jgi:hypothetical protein
MNLINDDNSGMLILLNMDLPAKKNPILILLVCIILVVSECINPYKPDLGSYKPLMVVEGLITNENRSYIIELSYSMQKNDSATPRISDANIYITDDEGNITHLSNFGSGIYKTDSIEITGSVGHTYQLHIESSDGRIYSSGTCMMLPVPDIDSVYFAKDVQLVNNQTQLKEGVSVFLDSKPGSGDQHYLRWDYEDTWKFKVPDPIRYTYINRNAILEIPPGEVKEYCWKSGKATELLINGVSGNNLNRIVKEPIKFIVTDESDRLSVRYSILVNQYSLSEQEFNYWDGLRKLNDVGSDIFGTQPFEVLGNIKNVNDPSEKVLGYFQVSAVSKKRIYIDYGDIYPYGLPNYVYHCISYPLGPGFAGIINPETLRPYTWDEFYAYMIRNYPYKFVRPIFNVARDSLFYLVFTTPVCSDCELSGSFTKPAYWIER